MFGSRINEEKHTYWQYYWFVRRSLHSGNTCRFLPLLWRRKWCRKGEVGRLSLVLERKEEQSFSIPARCSDKEEDGEKKGVGKKERERRGKGWQNKQSRKRRRKAEKPQKGKEPPAMPHTVHSLSHTHTEYKAAAPGGNLKEVNKEVIEADSHLVCGSAVVS